jgi:hypothetical protein
MAMLRSFWITKSTWSNTCEKVAHYTRTGLNPV